MTLYSTEWGALYLAVLIILMGPSLMSRPRRWLAASMFMLWACDRWAVALLPPELALFYLAFAYTLVSVAVVLTHPRRAGAIVAFTMVLTSCAFIAGGFGLLTWDMAGTSQELLGLIAMLVIVGGKHDGHHYPATHDRSAGHQRPDPHGAHAREQARK